MSVVHAPAFEATSEHFDPTLPELAESWFGRVFEPEQRITRCAVPSSRPPPPAPIAGGIDDPLADAWFV